MFQSSHWLLQWKRRVFFYNSKEKGPKNFFEGGKIESEEETEEEDVPSKSPIKLNKKSNGAIKRKIENSSIMMMGGRKTKKAKKF